MDGTMINVARDGFRKVVDSFACAVGVEVKFSASGRELVIADNMINDLPSPMLSVRIPPLASRCSGVSEFVSICWKLLENQFNIASTMCNMDAYRISPFLRLSRQSVSSAEGLPLSRCAMKSSAIIWCL